jgi:hypothetical protein
MQGKSFEFRGDVGGFAIVLIVSWAASFIPIIGWVFAFNFSNKWFAENTFVKGQQLSWRASFTDSLVFLVVQFLLLFVTLGIYVFWFGPKMYRFIADHVEFAGASVAQPMNPAVASQPIMPQAPVTSGGMQQPPMQAAPAAPEAPVGPQQPPTPPQPPLIQ